MDIIYILKKIITEPKGILKLLITGAISLIPFVGPVYLLGWICEVCSRADRGYSSVLPEFAPLTFLKNGLGLAICFVVYNLPILALFLLKKLLSVGADKLLPEAIGNGVNGFLGVLSTVIGTIWLFIFLFPVPMIIRLYMERYNVRDALDFGRVYRFSRGRVRELLAPLALLCAVLIFSVSGLSLMFVGIVITLPLAFAFYAYMIARMEVFVSL